MSNFEKSVGYAIVTAGLLIVLKLVGFDPTTIWVVFVAFTVINIFFVF